MKESQFYYHPEVYIMKAYPEKGKEGEALGTL